MSITAKELARILGLSPAAVSMALNNKPGVSTDTRRLVLETAEKHGYDFTKLADKHNIRGTIHLVIYRKHGAIVAETPFFLELSSGVAEGCRKADYKMQISYLMEDEDTIDAQLENIQFSDCAGLVVLGTEMTRDNVRRIQKLPLPFVLLDTYFEDLNCNYVLINNVQGAYQAASHLIKATGKQPGYLRSSYSIGNFVERNSGFFKAVRANGMSSAGSIVHFLTPSIDGAYADMKEILRSRDPIARAYFADNDLIALGAMKAFKEAGFRIPEDVALVGFDNLPASLIVDPPLTTIHVPKEEMGKVAAERLVTLIRDRSSAPMKIEMNTTLIRRKSS